MPLFKHLKDVFALPLLRVRSPESLVLYISMFVMGACGIAYEYTLSKIASDLLGNSVRQWAIIIGMMMFFMGVGADVPGAGHTPTSYRNRMHTPPSPAASPKPVRTDF